MNKIHKACFKYYTAEYGRIKTEYGKTYFYNVTCYDEGEEHMLPDVSCN